MAILFDIFILCASSPYEHPSHHATQHDHDPQRVLMRWSHMVSDMGKVGHIVRVSCCVASEVLGPGQRLLVEPQ